MAKNSTKVKGTKLVKVGAELPEAPARTRTEGYAEIVANLAAIQEEPGEWFAVWDWASGLGSEKKPAGAKKAELAFTSGRVDLPEGKGEYDIEARPQYVDGKRKGSVLYAKFDVAAAA